MRWLVAGLVWAAALGAAWAGEETRLAVVDVSRVFTSYTRVNLLQEVVDKEFDVNQRALEQEGKALEEESAKLEQRQDDGSDAFVEEVLSFRKKKLQFERRVEGLRRRLAQRTRENMRDILNEIRAAIRKEAVRQGFHIVMRSADAEDLLAEPNELPETEIGTGSEKELQVWLAPRNTEELMLRFKRNPVLFSAQPVDITQAVINELNASGGKGSGQTRPPAKP